MGTNTPHGITLWCLWGVEALIIVALIAILSGHGIAQKVFCETCGRWCDSITDFLRFRIPENDEPLQRIALGSLTPLLELERIGETADPFVWVELDQCLQCELTPTARVSVCRHKTNKEGKTEFRLSALTKRLLLSPEQLAKLQSLAKTPMPESPFSEEQSDA